ncbi:short-chain dehydrogenase [Coniophora puteana RWD-64-598 SS2]|uniref:Short-chain dehydrogenase n=1 Tax=Coniophora puteana (strain RWD-64-598) TaxID=741705 RepID=A0A5M3MNG8_CONPW|nr:short-chain dehydrogenase [Coniophora puteana RWD-64-598 SS2]EIW80560.1 short-chain dehydrogenase [Coniophora puteana RWD-64-598 SS2]
MTGFIKDQWSCIPPVVRADLSGQTVVVVGANVGIGLEASVHFASMGPERLIIACRSEGKGKNAVEEIEQRTGFKHTELWLLDLSSFTSVRAFADRFEREAGALDILAMNAGVLPAEYEATVDGWENCTQVNHLSTSLLPLLLLPRMVEAGKKRGRAARLVITASDVHYWASLSPSVQESPTPLKLFGSKEYCTPEVMKSRYYDSKLLNVLHTRALAAHLRTLSETPVTPVAVNPGFCWSQLRRDMPSNPTMWLAEHGLAWHPEKGARQLVFAALGKRGREANRKSKSKHSGEPSPEEDEITMRGAYVSMGTTQEVSDWVLGEEGVRMQERIWKETIEILKGVDPRVEGIVQEFLYA